MIARDYEELYSFLKDSANVLLVHGKSLEKFSHVNELISRLNVTHFTDYSPNPKLEDAEKAARISCDSILAVGGGSAIDTAKYARLKNPGSRFAVIPTTAGSGSEATRFAVLYENGKKLSLTDDAMLPDMVIMDPELLAFMPEYTRKSSALDAFSHALESFWSVNANTGSREYSREALSRITRLLEDYPTSYDGAMMQECAYVAGQAINISQTTAGHAMSYKITGMFGTSHGHSAAMCNRVLFRWLVRNSRLPVLNDIAVSMGCETPSEAALKFERIFEHMNLIIPRATDAQISELTSSVNPERLKNFPVQLDEHTIRELYCDILRRD